MYTLHHDATPLQIGSNKPRNLSDELDDTTGFSDLLLGKFGDESSFDDEWFSDTAFTELFSRESIESVVA